MKTSYIKEYYNNYNEDERTKSRHGSVEFTTNMKYIRQYVPQGAKILDVGAGTGSVSVELALAALEGQVFAVECEPEACALIRDNKQKFSAWNLHLVEGRAPEVLADLPAPDAVFIGGTKGGMEQIVDLALSKNENARICISAIALETLSSAIAALTKHGLEAGVAQIAVSRAKPAGKLHLLMANNPTFLITGERHA